MEKRLSKRKNIQAYVGETVSNNRMPSDFYETPKFCVDDLLDRVEFEGSFWECACGTGNISDALTNRNKVVVSTDIKDYGYSYQTNVMDFLEWECKTDCNIITNPPFEKSYEFTLHAINLTSKKVAMFNKLSFLEGQKRRKIFDLNYLENILVYSRRLNLKKTNAAGMMAFAWFVFNKDYKGKPSLDWI